MGMSHSWQSWKCDGEEFCSRTWYAFEVRDREFTSSQDEAVEHPR